MHLAGLDGRALPVPSKVRLDPVPSLYSTPLRVVLPGLGSAPSHGVSAQVSVRKIYAGAKDSDPAMQLNIVG
jgi:hypothetical protein